MISTEKDSSHERAGNPLGKSFSSLLKVQWILCKMDTKLKSSNCYNLVVFREFLIGVDSAN